jgi:hypothetical protein
MTSTSYPKFIDSITYAANINKLLNEVENMENNNNVLLRFYSEFGVIGVFFKTKDDETHQLFALFVCDKVKGITKNVNFFSYVTDCNKDSEKKIVRTRGVIKGLFLSGFGFTPLNLDFKLEEISILTDSFISNEKECPILEEMNMSQIVGYYLKMFDKTKLPSIWKDQL